MDKFVHAQTFETRWGVGLAFIDLDDEGFEVLKLRVWAPVCEDKSLASVEMKIGLSSGASDAAHDALESANRSALENMDASKFEAALYAAGFGTHLDKIFSEI